MKLSDSVSQYLVGLRHLGIVSEDRDALVERMQQLFGLADDEILLLPADANTPADTRFAFFSIGGTPYEVIEPVSEHFKQVLFASGSGANHVCYNVSDIEAAVTAMQAQGVRLGHVSPNGIIDTASFRMVYFDPRDTAGLLIEFVQERA